MKALLIKSIISSLLLLLLTACGGGGSGGNSYDGPTIIGTGRFIDGPVEGLTFSSASG